MHPLLPPRASGRLPILASPHPEKDEIACWFVRSGEAPFPMRVISGQAERDRHYRKYAEEDVRYKSLARYTLPE